MSLPQNTVGTVTTVASQISPVGGIVQAIAAFFSSLGIKGKTQHLSYDVAYPRAVSYGTSLYGEFVRAYGNGVDAKLWKPVQKHFLSALNVWWGVQGHPIGIPLQNSIANTDVPQSTQPLHTECQLYWQWILQGMDMAVVNSQKDIADTVNATFDLIFYPAIQDAGLDRSKLFGGQQPSAGTTEPLVPTLTPQLAGVPTGILAIVLGVGLLGAFIYSTSKG